MTTKRVYDEATVHTIDSSLSDYRVAVNDGLVRVWDADDPGFVLSLNDTYVQAVVMPMPDGSDGSGREASIRLASQRLTEIVTNGARVNGWANGVRVAVLDDNWLRVYAGGQLADVAPHAWEFVEWASDLEDVRQLTEGADV